MDKNKKRASWVTLLGLTLLFSLSIAPTQSLSDTHSTKASKGDKLRPELPTMNARRGRKLFAEKGCAVCHSVNGIGGNVGPALDWANMPQPMDAFGFVARMWRGAPAMSLMQEEIFGDVISLSGQDLVDLVAFAHDEEEQKKLTKDQIPQKLQNLLPQ